MSTLLPGLVMPVARRLDPERAHRLALTALRLGLGGCDRAPDDPALATTVWGRTLRNPLGLAAGFDKNAQAVRGLRRLGFGFVETGTVTPQPQGGNPAPRLFRLVEDGAVINRMGFNNAGLSAYLSRLATLPRGSVPLGANLGVNKHGADPERDYPALVAAVAPHVDYLVVNVSSPNTPGLRDLQTEGRLRAILHAIRDAVPRRPPLLVKLAPDLSEAGLEAVVGLCLDGGADGLVLTNTTTGRPPGLRSPLAAEAGGLSGAPLRPLAMAALRRARRLAGDRLILVAAGGIDSGTEALARLRAGARLVQVYTAFAYGGPAAIRRIKRELADALRRDGFANVAEAVGADAP